MAFLPVDDQLELISRGTEEVIPLNDLRKKLEKSISDNKPLTVKLGCDPSRPDLHIEPLDGLNLESPLIFVILLHALYVDLVYSDHNQA